MDELIVIQIAVVGKIKRVIEEVVFCVQILIAGTSHPNRPTIFLEIVPTVCDSVGSFNIDPYSVFFKNIVKYLSIIDLFEQKSIGERTQVLPKSFLMHINVLRKHHRSEERRVGKEGRSRRMRDQE